MSYEVKFSRARVVFLTGYLRGEEGQNIQTNQVCVHGNSLKDEVLLCQLDSFLNDALGRINCSLLKLSASGALNFWI